jgi:hypothetical protein
LGKSWPTAGTTSGALARLGLARAYAVEAGLSRHGENGGIKPPLQQDALAKARAAYQDFLTLWKDAGPDIPILKEAKAEYAKLKKSPRSGPRFQGLPRRTNFPP